MGRRPCFAVEYRDDLPLECLVFDENDLSQAGHTGSTPSWVARHLPVQPTLHCRAPDWVLSRAGAVWLLASDASGLLSA